MVLIMCLMPSNGGMALNILAFGANILISYLAGKDLKVPCLVVGVVFEYVGHFHATLLGHHLQSQHVPVKCLPLQSL